MLKRKNVKTKSFKLKPPETHQISISKRGYYIVQLFRYHLGLFLPICSYNNWTICQCSGSVGPYYDRQVGIVGAAALHHYRPYCLTPTPTTPTTYNNFQLLKQSSLTHSLTYSITCCEEKWLLLLTLAETWVGLITCWRCADSLTHYLTHSLPFSLMLLLSHSLTHSLTPVSRPPVRKWCRSFSTSCSCLAMKWTRRWVSMWYCAAAAAAAAVVCVCACVCEWVSEWVSVCVCVCVCAWVSAWVREWVRECVSVWVCEWVCICMCIFVWVTVAVSELE